MRDNLATSTPSPVRKPCEYGGAMLELALAVACIAVVAIASVGEIGQKVTSIFDKYNYGDIGGSGNATAPIKSSGSEGGSSGDKARGKCR